ncbi:hypothetical protein [uncultured Microbacterium sp.]|nr:hypothetical protein [uncultured Microbacterium sp.]
MRSLNPEQPTSMLANVALDLIEVGLQTRNQDMTNTGLDLCATVIAEAFR